MNCNSSPNCQVHGSLCVADNYEGFGIDLCPICGDEIIIIGRTTDGRLIGSCRDAFTAAQWNDDD